MHGFMDDGVDDRIRSLRDFFDRSIEISSKINGYKNLKIADKYIEIAKVMIDEYQTINFRLEDKQKKAYLSYFEKCLVESFEIKKEILGVKDEQTRAICYELYQFYIESYMENSLDKDIIEVMKDSEKALYYGKLYLGD